MSDIKDLIKTHVEKLTGVTITYQYSDLYEMHLLEILPYEKLENDAVFDAVQDIIDNYVDQHPSESWYVVSPDSRVKIVGTPTLVVERQEGYTKSTATNDLYDQNAIPRTYLPIILMSKTIKVGYKAHSKLSNEPSKEVFRDMSEYAIAA